MKMSSQTIKNIVSAGVFIAFAMSLQADYHVALNGSNTSPYDTWAKAATNIQTVVAAAPSGSTIRVADGTYSALSGKTTIIDLSTGALAAKSLTFYGNTNDPAQVVLDGKGTQRGLLALLSTVGQTLELNGFTFSNCYGTLYNGGGITLQPSASCQAVVRNCNFVQNRVQAGNSGAGVTLSSKSGVDVDVLFSNCVFLANSATSGGALYAWLIKNITMVDCRAVGNAATGVYGGGAFSFASSQANLLACTFISNRCDNANTEYGGGGAMSTSVSSAALTACHFEENEAIGQGGGAVYSLGSLFATNCVFRNNRCDNRGSAILVHSKSPQTWLYNCLLVGNLRRVMDTYSEAIHGANTTTGKYVIVNSTIVSNSGGVGVLGNSRIQPGPIVEIRNSIIRNNLRADGTTNNYVVYDASFSKIYNTATAPMPAPALDGGGNTLSDPNFVSLAGGNFHLQLGSPCIDTGLNQDWMIAAKDLDGRPRVDYFSQKVDMGCYEFQKSGSVVIIQ